MKNDPFIVGLTGQTGSGKSCFSAYFRELGLYVIDCDKVSRTVTQDGSECCKRLSIDFPSCFDGNFHLNRKALGAIVFNQPDKLQLLNSLIFPYINEEISAEIAATSENGCVAIILDAPTLFESGADKLCSLVISCIAYESIRCERIMRRDSLSLEQAMNRIRSQKSEEFFVKNSDIIIENDGGISSLARAAGYLSIQIKGMLYGFKEEKQEKEKRNQ